MKVLVAKAGNLSGGIKRSRGRDLAKAIAETALSPKAARLWRHDLAVGHKILKPPENKWE